MSNKVVELKIYLVGDKTYYVTGEDSVREVLATFKYKMDERETTNPGGLRVLK